MKFNPLDWSEIKANAEIQVPSGLLQLRCTGSASLFVTSEGVETCYGHGTEFRLTLPEEATVKVNILTPGRVFKRDVKSRTVRDTSEKFTNIDRLPQESGTMLEVTRALRTLKLEERAMVRRIREERAQAEAVIERTKPPAPAPEPEPDPAPEPEAAK